MSLLFNRFLRLSTKSVLPLQKNQFSLANPRHHQTWFMSQSSRRSICYNNSKLQCTEYFSKSEEDDIPVDVAIVGAGPSGLATAIRLKQLNPDINVAVLEKSSEIGGHIVSGNVMDTIALDELLPGWRLGLPKDLRKSGDFSSPPSTLINQDLLAPSVFPFRSLVVSDSFYLLTKLTSIKCPSSLLPPALRNTSTGDPKAFVMSLSEFCRWFAQIAEALGVIILTSASAAAIVLDEATHRVQGVRLKDDGVNKLGDRTQQYQRGARVLCSQLVLAEGCRGSLSEFVKSHFQLVGNSCPQRYALGLKEVWEIDPEQHRNGEVIHTVGFPLDGETFGGGFLYHQIHSDQRTPLVHVGLVIGLDYKNPWLNLYEEFQTFKTHPLITKLLLKGKRLSYGARCISEGGIQSIPAKIDFPGGVLVGDSVGYVNVPRIKGVHTAMKSGMVAAEWLVKHSLNPSAAAAAKSLSLLEATKQSWIWTELNQVRNAKPCFSLPGGLWSGLVGSFLTLAIMRGKEPWTLRWDYTDASTTKHKTKYPRKSYAKHDGVISFDLLENLSYSNVEHRADQPPHLVVTDPHSTSWESYEGLETRFCPAAVYEFPESSPPSRIPKLHINAQNCIHCKCCSVKAPQNYIRWTVPEGGGGPNYTNL